MRFLEDGRYEVWLQQRLAAAACDATTLGFQVGRHAAYLCCDLFAADLFATCSKSVVTHVYIDATEGFVTEGFVSVCIVSPTDMGTGRCCHTPQPTATAQAGSMSKALVHVLPLLLAAHHLMPMYLGCCRTSSACRSPV
jgi:hypothetical protein